jgi:hypothetical protein
MLTCLVALTPRSQARSTTKQGPGANRDYVRGGLGLCLDESQHDIVIHPRLPNHLLKSRFTPY